MTDLQRVKYEPQKLTPISFDENRALQLQILRYVRDFCRDNHITFYLSDGTLLGAVRHKGFIPWDDDIDIEMPRPDYERFASLFRDTERYAMVRPGDPASRFHCIKVYDKRTVKIEEGVEYHGDYLGVDIDIFTVDGSSPDQEQYEKDRVFVNRCYQRYCLLKAGFAGVITKRIKYLLYKVFLPKPEILLERAVAVCKAHPYAESPYVTRYGRFGLGYRVEKKEYASAVYMEFEGESFPAPCGYDAVLTAAFGDYRKLPPLEEQVTHHSNTVFWRPGKEADGGKR